MVEFHTPGWTTAPYVNSYDSSLQYYNSIKHVVFEVTANETAEASVTLASCDFSLRRSSNIIQIS